MKSQTSLSVPVLVSLCCAIGCGGRASQAGLAGEAHAGSGGLGGSAFAGARDSFGGSTDRAGDAAGRGGDGAIAPEGGSTGDAIAEAGNSGSAESNGSMPLIGGPCSALTAAATSYVAHKTRTLVSPAPNVVGVAADATSIWLLSATHGNGLATITRYALPAQKILFQFQTIGFVLPSGSDFYGIEVSPDTIYLSVAGPDFTDVTTYDPKSHEPTGDFESPTGWVPLGVGPSDLALLDGKLLVGMGSGTLELVEFSPDFTREIFTSYRPDSGRDSGLATCNEFVVWGGLYEGITVLDRTGQAIGSVVQSDGQPFRQPYLGALAFFGNQLVIAAPDALAFYTLEAKPRTP